MPAKHTHHEARVFLVGHNRNGDCKGTLFTATRLLKSHGVSINALRTTTFDASKTGMPMHVTTADVVLPDDLEPARLIGVLKEIAVDIAVDVQVNQCVAV